MKLESIPTYMDSLAFAFKHKSMKNYLCYIDCHGLMRLRPKTDKEFKKSLEEILGRSKDIVSDDWFHFSLESLKNKKKFNKFKTLIDKYGKNGKR